MGSVHIVDTASLQKKIDAILDDGGVKSVQIITDFDRTLTPHLVDGQKSSTSFATFREYGYLNDDYAQEAQAMYDKYRPNEEDPAIADEWWNKHLQLLVDSGVTYDHVKRIVTDGRIRLRRQAKVLLDLCETLNIPVTIFSAGVGNLIDFFIRNYAYEAPNLHLVSNMIEFDEFGRATGYNRNVIHTANKHAIDIEEGQTESFASLVADRPHVIVIGDSLKDSEMYAGDAIRIGVINGGKSAISDEHKKRFDVLLVDDVDLPFIVDFLEVTLCQ